MVSQNKFEVALPASPTSSTRYTLPFSVYLQPIDSTPLAHSLEKHRGYTPIRPISELISNRSAMHSPFGLRRFSAAFTVPAHSPLTLSPKLQHTHNSLESRDAPNAPPIHAPFTIPRDPASAL